MSGIGGVSPGANVADLMKILEQSQEQSLDMAKKLIKIAATETVSANEAQGKGALLDVLA